MSRPNACLSCGHRLADCRCRTTALVLPCPTLAHAAAYLLWFAQLDAVVSQGREFLNGGRR